MIWTFDLTISFSLLKSLISRCLTVCFLLLEPFSFEKTYKMFGCYRKSVYLCSPK